MKTSTVLLFCFGFLVLIFIQYKAFQEHTLYTNHKIKNETKKIVEESHILQTVQRSGINLEKKEKKIIDKKVGIFISFDYEIQFKSLSNSDKIDKIETISKNILKFTIIKKLKNNLNILKTLNELLIDLNNNTPENKETLVFLWITSLSTKVWGKNGCEGAICMGNEVMGESDFKDLFLKFTKLTFICGFEPCNETFYPQLQIHPKSNLSIEPTKKKFFVGNTMLNKTIVPINYKLAHEFQKYPTFEFHELSKFMDYSINWDFNIAVEKNYPLEKFIWCFSSTNLTNIFSMYYQLAGPFLSVQSIMGFLEKQGVQQSLSRLPPTIENVFQVE